MNDEILIQFYAVRNANGFFMRNKARSFSAYKNAWAEKLTNGKIYTKPGPARSQITYFAKHHPQFGVPELVILPVKEIIVMLETERVKASLQQKKVQEAARKKSNATHRLKQAEEDLMHAQNYLKRIKSELC